jgi:dynein heavy chain 1, cytosolic
LSRHEFGEYIRAITTIQMPANQSVPLIDFEVTMDGEFSPWISKVPSIEIETHRVAATDLVIPTIDTIRHETLLNTWLAEHKPLVLCGPPGSGKTMTLFSALRALPGKTDNEHAAIGRVPSIRFRSCRLELFVGDHARTHVENVRSLL